MHSHRVRPQVVVFVSKMISVPASALPRDGPPLTGNTEGEVFLGFGRVFSGTLRAGQKVYVLAENYDPRYCATEELYAVLNNKHRPPA